MEILFFFLDSELFTMKSSSFVKYPLKSYCCHMSCEGIPLGENSICRINYPPIQSFLYPEAHRSRASVVHSSLYFAFFCRLFHVVLISFPLFLLHSAVHPRATLVISKRLFGFLSTCPIHQYFMYAVSVFHRYFLYMVHMFEKLFYRANGC